MKVVAYVLYQLDEESGEVRRLGQDICDNVEFGKDVQVYCMDDMGNWPALEGVLCDIEVVNNRDDFMAYNIPAQIGDAVYNIRAVYLYDSALLEQAAEELSDELNQDEEPQMLRFDYKGHYEVMGMWEGFAGGDNMSNSNIVGFSSMEGREFQLLYPLSEGDDGRLSYARSEDMTMYRGMEMEEIPLPAGVYYVAYGVEDVFGRLYIADPVRLNWDGEHCVAEMME